MKCKAEVKSIIWSLQESLVESKYIWFIINENIQRGVEYRIRLKLKCWACWLQCSFLSTYGKSRGNRKISICDLYPLVYDGLHGRWADPHAFFSLLPRSIYLRLIYRWLPRYCMPHGFLISSTAHPLSSNNRLNSEQIWWLQMLAWKWRTYSSHNFDVCWSLTRHIFHGSSWWHLWSKSSHFWKSHSDYSWVATNDILH